MDSTAPEPADQHALFVHLPLVFLIANLGQVVVLYAASRLIVDGNLPLGEWRQFSLYLVYVFFRSATWAHHFADVRRRPRQSVSSDS